MNVFEALQKCRDQIANIDAILKSYESDIGKDAKLMAMAIDIYEIYKKCPGNLMSKGELKAYSMAQYIVDKYKTE